jgi:predicted DNA-binding protein (MmcQ/YjbR family)
LTADEKTEGSEPNDSKHYHNSKRNTIVVLKVSLDEKWFQLGQNIEKPKAVEMWASVVLP